jgi:membrane protein insertase Oxa1/YidC/SpoIIIJ
MASRSLNLLAVVWWIMLPVSMAAFFVFAWYTPQTGFFSSANARDAEIQSIKSVTDVGLLQQKAILYVLAGYATGATKALLCHIALGTLLLIIIGSVVGLVQLRWIRRHLSDSEDAD